MSNYFVKRRRACLHRLLHLHCVVSVKLELIVWLAPAPLPA